MLSNDNVSGPITPPKYFTRYCVPYYRQFAAELHKRDKCLPCT